MNETRMVRKLASEIFGQMNKTDNAKGVEIWAFRDLAPLVEMESWQNRFVREFHEIGDDGTPVWGPDDYRYEFAAEALSRIAEQKYGGPESLLSYVEHDYNLYTWLGSHGFRPGYVDEVLQKDWWRYDGRRRTPTLEGLVGAGQIQEKREVLRIVLRFLRNVDPHEILGEDACDWCGEDSSGGEGYDGLCGNCADAKAEGIWKF